MKYIKIYEEFSNNFYLEVQDYEYYDANRVDLDGYILDEDGEFNTTDIYSTGQKLDQNNIKSLKEIFKDWKYVCFMGEVFLALKEYERSNISGKTTPHFKIWITQDSDEWFWVKFDNLNVNHTRQGLVFIPHDNIKSIYFKCDQFEGVRKLINDYIIE